MEEQEIRNELIQFLKKQNPTQLMNLHQHFEELCRKKGSTFQGVFFKVRGIINEYINNNLLMWGDGRPGSGMPWLVLTCFGKKCLDEDNIIPYDPEGYIDEIKRQIPNIDDLTLIYLKESVAVYNKRCPLSASITLGCASENLMQNLIDMSTKFFEEGDREREIYSRKLEKARNILSSFKVFKERILLLTKQEKLPKKLTRDIDVVLEGMFQFIRIYRNKSGHPSGIIPSIKVVYSNLQMFLDYAKLITELIEFMSTNPCK